MDGKRDSSVISTADAIVVIDVLVIDDQGRAVRRGARGRVTADDRSVRTITDFSLDPGV